MAIAETICPPPPVRANSILMPHPTNSKELFLFGGEIYTGTPPVAKFYNDLYVYHTEVLSRSTSYGYLYRGGGEEKLMRTVVAKRMALLYLSKQSYAPFGSSDDLKRSRETGTMVVRWRV